MTFVSSKEICKHLLSPVRRGTHAITRAEVVKTYQLWPQRGGPEDRVSEVLRDARSPTTGTRWWPRRGRHDPCLVCLTYMYNFSLHAIARFLECITCEKFGLRVRNISEFLMLERCKNVKLLQSLSPF